jgi:hypothetical protein
LADFIETPFDFGIHVRLMIVIEGERGVDLAQAEMRKLKMHLFGAGAVGPFVQDDFDHLDVGVGDPSHPLIIDLDMGNFSRNHGFTPDRRGTIDVSSVYLFASKSSTSSEPLCGRAG